MDLLITENDLVTSHYMYQFEFDWGVPEEEADDDTTFYARRHLSNNCLYILSYTFKTEAMYRRFTKRVTTFYHRADEKIAKFTELTFTKRTPKTLTVALTAKSRLTMSVQEYRKGRIEKMEL